MKLPEEDGWHHVGPDLVAVGRELMHVKFFVVDSDECSRDHRNIVLVHHPLILQVIGFELLYAIQRIENSRPKLLLDLLEIT